MRHLVVIDGKKLGVVIVVMGLMILLFGVGINMNNRIRATAFIQMNLGALKLYDVNEYKINYKLPLKWTTNLENLSGSEIVYHNNYKSEDNSIRGFVEIWNFNGDLKAFLDKSKTISETQNEVQNYNISKIRINNHDGYMVTYKIQSQDQFYNAFEYLIKDNGRFIRFSFYVNSNKINNDMPSVFKAIVETLTFED